MLLDKLTDLIETIDRLFVSGADTEHAADDMLDLLEDLDFRNLLDVLIEAAEPLYSYKLESDYPYRGKPLAEFHAVRLYEDIDSETINVGDGTSCQHSLELWLLADMSLLVTSCFRTIIPDKLFSEYRSIKGNFWKDTDMHIDFVVLSDTLIEWANAFDLDGLPMHEL